jgi:hypothetical protein
MKRGTREQDKLVVRLEKLREGYDLIVLPDHSSAQWALALATEDNAIITS